MGYGERLKLVRGNLPQEDFAKILGVHKNTIGRFERETGKPNIEEINAILSAYPEINPTWLLTGEGPMKGFTCSDKPTAALPKQAGPAVELVVSDDTLELISEILDEKIGARRSEISADKAMALITTLHRFYSRNFIDSAKFRRDTMEKNIESLVKLALPE